MPAAGTILASQLIASLPPAAGVAAGAWVSNLTDGFKYVLGSKYLPTGFEVGFNHYAGQTVRSHIQQCATGHVVIVHETGC
jgi:hypothetical protein